MISISSPAPVAALRKASRLAAAGHVPAIPADARVAVIGDSHTAGVFGASLKLRLQGYLQKGGGRLTFFKGVPSSGVSNFLNGTPTQAGAQHFQTPTVDSVLKTRPNVLVVALGTNMLFGSVASNKRQIEALLAKADKAHTRVVWVGPPNVHGFGGNLAGPRPEANFYRALSEVNVARKKHGKAPVTVIDSRPSTNENATLDGVHFGGVRARRWARDVFAAAIA